MKHTVYLREVHDIFSANKYENANNSWHFHIILAGKISCLALFSRKEFAIATNMRFIGRTNFLLSWVEHEKCFKTSGSGRCYLPLEKQTTVRLKLKSSVLSDQGIRCLHEETLQPWLSKMRPVRNLIRIREPFAGCTYPKVRFLTLWLNITKTCLFKYIENLTSKDWKFSEKINLIFFHISAQNTDCGYSLEPPRRGVSNEYPQSMFLGRNKKHNIYPCKPQFYYIKVGYMYKGVNII